MFDTETSEKLDILTRLLTTVCLDYISEVGKLGAANNGVTNQWLVRNGAAGKIRRLLKELKSSYLGRSREEKYYLLREIYALKPGIHERFYPEAHEGTVLKWMQERFGGGMSLPSIATYYLKSILTIENFHYLPPFLSREVERVYPFTIFGAQQATRYFMEATNWKSLDELRPLDSWLGYSPCAINEGPFASREGKVLFESLGNLDGIAIGYRSVLERINELGPGEIVIPSFIG